ncbi:MAG: D-alanyl-D-alanine carboxypeptidase [Alphaproteobacteria bacterium]|nr:D-alanyl-D-alanine carboxypeptidase [Alphaproteobacteria bacterium]
MKIFIFLFSLIFSFSVLAQKAWLVVDGQSGEVILEQNADMQRYPASLTKMMVLYVVFDALKKGVLEEEQYLTVSSRAASQVPSKLGLRLGEKITVKEAVLGLIIKSANDAAVVLSEHLSGKEETFADIMTRAAKQIGLSKTNFENASGLGDDDQVSTAKDMALLGMALYRHFPKYYKWFSKKSFWFKGVEIKTHNHLLKSYPGTDGLKTGYIRKSGFNSIVSVEQKGQRLFGVVLGANSIDARDTEVVSVCWTGKWQN